MRDSFVAWWAPWRSAANACAPERRRRSDGTATERGDHEPQPRRPVHGRQLVVDAAFAGQPADELPDVHGRAARTCRAECPTSTSRWSRRTWARATATSPVAIHRRRQRDLPVHAARDLHAVAADAGATYISNVNGVANYSGDIAVFSCIAALGETGCGFEHQFESILRALGAEARRRPPRTRAFSVATRCWRRHGHQRGRLFRAPRASRCTTRAPTSASRPARAAGELPLQRVRSRLQRREAAPEAPGEAVTAMVPQQNCTSAECTGLLAPVGEFIARIRALKAAPDSEMWSAAIAGPSDAVHGHSGTPPAP